MIILQSSIYEQQMDYRINYPQSIDNRNYSLQDNTTYADGSGLRALIGSLSNSISSWWRGGDVENEGSVAGWMWCAISGMNYEGWNYDFVEGACEVFGEFHPRDRM